jgi:HD-GYP domain-containing protein (c-di-GMP phosphodiesterase class II)
LLSLADAFDVMTISRPYSVPKTMEQAISECESLIGRQFTRSAVGALIQLYESGELGNREPIWPVFAGR